jgi:hypothetical protein
MSRTREIEEVPPKFDEEGNPVAIEEGSKTRASNAPTLEELRRTLEKLMVENKKLRGKAKNKKRKAIIESPSEEEDEDEKEYNEDEVALFIKKFNKFIKKRRPYKGDRREAKVKESVLQLWQERAFHHPMPI